ncbi:MAG: DUF167 domain-containing protein [Pyrinomonadaceae bacterium]
MDVLEKDGSISFPVRVIPRASRSEIVGEHDGAMKIKIAAPPVDGAANTELIKLLANKFNVSKGDIEITGGETSKNKRIKITNLSESKFREVTR